MAHQRPTNTRLSGLHLKTWRERGASGDGAAVVMHPAGDSAEHRNSSPAPPIDSNELGIADTSLDDLYGVITRWHPDQLELHVILVGPKIRHRVVLLSVSGPNQQIPAGRDALARGMIPVLYPQMLLIQRVPPAGDIACGDDTGRTLYGAGRIADHAVVHLES